MTLQIPQDTIQSSNLLQELFADEQVDFTFRGVRIRAVQPDTPTDISQNKIAFTLKSLTGTEVYILNELIMAVSLRIRDERNKPPNQNTLVGTVNNIGHSLFESVGVTLNGTATNNNNKGYPYKAYISNLLSSDTEIKSSELQTCGFYMDGYGEDSHPVPANTGFMQRVALFLDAQKRKKPTPNGKEQLITDLPYKSHPTDFIYPLKTELQSSAALGLPGVQVRLELQKSDPGFVIMMPVEAAGQAAHNYAVQITNSQLYVPVGTLTTPMYKTIESKLERNKMHIPYRSTEIVHHIFGKDRNYFSTNRLFSGEGNPCRIVVGFVELPAYSGDQFLNTFNFKRRFKTDASDVFRYNVLPPVPDPPAPVPLYDDHDDNIPESPRASRPFKSLEQEMRVVEEAMRQERAFQRRGQLDPRERGRFLFGSGPVAKTSTSKQKGSIAFGTKGTRAAVGTKRASVTFKKASDKKKTTEAEPPAKRGRPRKADGQTKTSKDSKSKGRGKNTDEARAIIEANKMAAKLRQETLRASKALKKQLLAGRVSPDIPPASVEPPANEEEEQSEPEQEAKPEPDPDGNPEAEQEGQQESEPIPSTSQGRPQVRPRRHGKGKAFQLYEDDSIEVVPGLSSDNESEEYDPETSSEEQSAHSSDISFINDAHSDASELDDLLLDNATAGPSRARLSTADSELSFQSALGDPLTRNDLEKRMKKAEQKVDKLAKELILFKTAARNKFQSIEDGLSNIFEGCKKKFDECKGIKKKLMKMEQRQQQQDCRRALMPPRRQRDQGYSSHGSSQGSSSGRSGRSGRRGQGYYEYQNPPDSSPQAVLPPQALLPPPRAVPGPPDEEDLPDAEKNYFYITKVDLQLKGASLDALHHPQTFDNCQDDFFKMLYSNGYIGTGTSCGLTQDEFKESSYLVCFDLTASGNHSNEFVLTNTLTGNLVLAIDTNIPTTRPICVIIYTEFASVLNMDKNKNWTRSYVQ